ncbi:septin-2 isoform X2 [Folsomia candida]|uniref:septin-2 isoform X2 n=1 Tax=Folsomia candida TaxID=158441 RepID=UPI001604BA2A|nr:septin-2 isoform X2 [Folsomia candida]
MSHSHSSNYAQPYHHRPPFSSSGPTVSTDRPATLNLQGKAAGPANSTNSNPTGLGMPSLPHKPTRYTPVYPTLMMPTNNPTISSGAGSKSSSYSSLTSSTPYSAYTRQPQNATTTTNQPLQPLTAQLPPKTLNTYESRHQYYQPAQRLQQYPPSHPSVTNLSNVSSKSAQNLGGGDSVPDVFCLSCPPAEFKFSDAYRAKTLPRVGKENERLIGFATLPEQVHRKSVKKGFDFTLMVVGESGLGKSTLINSLFLADFYNDRKLPTVSDLIKKTTSIQQHTIEIEERGVKLRLTVVDTPGFGDSINCEESWKTCVDYIDDQFHQYFQAESGLNRKHIQDGRVHCCLYFIPSYGRGLRQLDIQSLKTLQTRVNIIPVIGKSDILTPTEVRTLKDSILEDLKSNHIQIYQFPDCDEEEDEEFKKQDRELKAAIPFAVASSDTFVEVAGKRFRGRVYPWGIVEGGKTHYYYMHILFVYTTTRVYIDIH